jgi:hypothetical protein
MKVFISYSFNNTERYLVSLLSNELRKKGFSVTSSSPPTIFNPSTYELNISNQINSADLFIGLMTKDGTNNKNAFNEWKYALNIRVTSILLIEKGVRLIPKELNLHPNIIRFDRENPNDAIQRIIALGNNNSNALQRVTPFSGTTTNANAKNGLIIGLAALGIAALIGLLAEDQ